MCENMWIRALIYNKLCQLDSFGTLQIIFGKEDIFYLGMVLNFYFLITLKPNYVQWFTVYSVTVVDGMHLK